MDERCSFDRIIGQSAPMRQVYGRVAKVVGSDVTVLIHGESGTGKELLAEAIHHNSHRSAAPFVKLNCVAIPDGLLESELFGHERGAFTGAVAQRKGKFELAHTGTLFLDEIGDMAPGTQAKMLRVLQEREIERVGGNETLAVDVRIIAATNRDLAEAVARGTFREDLYYRLNEFPICLPSLAERRDDIPLLVSHFVALFARQEGKPVRGFSDEALRVLLHYDWPGNIRQLRGVVRSAVLLAEDEVVGAECLPPELRTYQPQAPDDVEIEAGQSIDDVLERIERRIICDALQRAGGVQAQAARLLGCTDRSLWHRVKKLDIDVDSFKPAPARADAPAQAHTQAETAGVAH
ncbi:MAG: sigma-54 interaction domain-containing protein, partial [Planctomycetota bacterium]